MKLLDPKKISAKLTMTSQEQRLSHKGMAHFAGTGPNGRTCRECIHWDHFNGSYRKTDGRISKAPCKMFTELTRGTKGMPVPDDAMACRYFEFNSSAPEKYRR
ncbi:hypothetical protein [Bradyrhizobium sp. 150]|uniref:hypothetical protein n=1 Tax=Bradyrhizobium sp. 150 TaxID=2782625 RepID=UPI001FF720B6|nr:hypothetical protein [Bradyrhizobium sp. 150]MCK1671064.1 hypothetical protein [Bradyrhizobium sp. 150]